MRYNWVLPDPATYDDRAELEEDAACARRAGYDAVELQVEDPAAFEEARVGEALRRAGVGMCAFQTGGFYATRGNCLCTADAAVRRRTEDLLLRFVDLAAFWKAILVLGSLQGRRKDESDREAGSARIRDSIARVGRRATEAGVTVAFEPVNHGLPRGAGAHRLPGSCSIGVYNTRRPRRDCMAACLAACRRA